MNAAALEYGLPAPTADRASGTIIGEIDLGAALLSEAVALWTLNRPRRVEVEAVRKQIRRLDELMCELALHLRIEGDDGS